MDSIKAKNNDYTLINGKAVGGISIVPIDSVCKQVLVAWEWPDAANEGFFSISRIVCKDKMVDILTDSFINHVMDYGTEVIMNQDSKKFFPRLF